MNIILNERAYIEEILSSLKKPDDISMKRVIKLLAIYNHHVLGLKNQKNADRIIEVLKALDPEYSITKYSQIIDQYVGIAKVKHLVEIEYIPVTEAELEKIRELDSIGLEKFMFTALVYTKYHNLINPQNNNWVDTPLKILWQEGDIRVKNRDKFSMTHKLTVMGLINMSSNSRVNFKVNIINNSSHVVLKITDMRKLGLQYLSYKGLKKDKNIKLCKGCGIHFRAKSPNQLYCSNCLDDSSKDEPKVIHCIDCSAPIIVPYTDNHTKRCKICKDEYYKKLKREYIQKRRSAV